MSVRSATLGDIDAIKAIAVDTGMFAAEHVGFVDDTLTGGSDDSLDDHHWLVGVDADGTVEGAAYYAPEPFSDRLWNLYFIAVRPTRQGDGVGGRLLAAVEDDLRRRGSEAARIMIVETSSTDQYARTREFYPKHGFVEEARIRGFYGPDDDKVVFWKDLGAS